MNEVMTFLRLIGVVLCIIGMLGVVVLYKVNELEGRVNKLAVVLLSFVPRNVLDERIEKLRAEGALPPKEGGAKDGE